VLRALRGRMESSRRRSLQCRTTFGITRSWASFTNCLHSKSSETFTERDSEVQNELVEPLRMPAASRRSSQSLEARRRAETRRLPFCPQQARTTVAGKVADPHDPVLANSLVPIFGPLFGYAAGLFKVVDNKDVKTWSLLMTFALELIVLSLHSRASLLWEQAKGP